MKTEVPVFKRCCCCLPMRYGILIWGYLCLLGNILVSLTDLCILWEFYEIRFEYRFWLYFLTHNFNLALTILLIIAAHRKNSRLLKIYSYCGVVAVAVTFVLVIYGLVMTTLNLWEEHIRLWVAAFVIKLVEILYVGLQLYVLAVVRSEVLKLDSQHQVRFYVKQTNVQADIEKNLDADREKSVVDKQDSLHADKQKNLDAKEQDHVDGQSYDETDDDRRKLISS